MTQSDLMWHRRLREKGAAKIGALYIWRQQEIREMKRENGFRETVVGYCLAVLLAIAVSACVWAFIVQIERLMK